MSAKLFWKLFKQRTRATSDYSRLPESVLDADGNTVTEPAAVLKCWRDFVCKLGSEDPLAEMNRGDRISNFDDEFARKILETIRSASFAGGGTPELDEPVTWNEVLEAISVMRDGSASGLDGTGVELLHNAGIGLAVSLALLFNIVWSRLEWPRVATCISYATI